MKRLICFFKGHIQNKEWDEVRWFDSIPIFIWRRERCGKIIKSSS